MNSPVFKTTSGGTGGGGGPKKSGAYVVELKTGDFVFREGDLGTEMFIIHEGKIEILNSVGGKETILAVLEKGDFFGEMSILEDVPRAEAARGTSSRIDISPKKSPFSSTARMVSFPPTLLRISILPSWMMNISVPRSPSRKTKSPVLSSTT